MTSFTTSDQRTLRVAAGFREFVLSERVPVTPRDGWEDEQYAASAHKRRARFERLVARLEHWCGPLKDTRVLDAGCGDGMNCLLLAQRGVRQAVGIDLFLPVFADDAKGERTRVLARHVLQLPRGADVLSEVVKLPVAFEVMDATRMAFPDHAFDLVISRSAMEHFRPVEAALDEIVRIVRPGGIVSIGIDPFFWIRGCHKRGVVDLPWAHARLSLDDYCDFVRQYEGEAAAVERRRRLETLNRLTVAEWRALIERTGCEVLEWAVDRSSLGERVLAEHRDVPGTLLQGVSIEDLLGERISVALRKRRVS